MNDEDERRDEMAGFCPPPGIVHESLMVKKYYLTENQIIYLQFIGYITLMVQHSQNMFSKLLLHRSP